LLVRPVSAILSNVDIGVRYTDTRFLSRSRIHVLHHADEGKVYRAWLTKKLTHHGHSISPGTLYPTLHGPEKAGYLASEKRVVRGCQRRYYTITQAGIKALAEARTRLKDLIDEVLDVQDQSVEAQ
jgi:DNA-binding PadR family transcriptional regulator